MIVCQLIYLVKSVCLSVCQCVCLSEVSSTVVSVSQSVSYSLSQSVVPCPSVCAFVRVDGVQRRRAIGLASTCVLAKYTLTCNHSDTGAVSLYLCVCVYNYVCHCAYV